MYTISYGNLTFSATNYGACLTSLIVPDKNNNKDDIIVGFPTFQGYISNWMCHGAIVGRYANRISNASFRIDDITYQLDKNGENEDNKLSGCALLDKTGMLEFLDV